MCERLYCEDFLFIRITWQSPSLGANFSYTKLCSVKYGGKALGYFECIPTHFSLEVREANRKSRRTRRWTKQLESRPAFHCLRFSLKTRSREWAITKQKWWCLKGEERSRVPYPRFMLDNGLCMDSRADWSTLLSVYHLAKTNVFAFNFIFC